VTSGIVSVTNRRLPAGPAATILIQHDAATPRGMEGGPLVTTRGEVVGVNILVAIDGDGFVVPSLPDIDLPDVPGVDVDLPDLTARIGSGAAIAFAVPADTASRVATSIVADGRVAYPYLGVSATVVTDEIAVVQGLNEPVGVVIEEVLDDSPAGVAGLQIEDVIVAIDGEPFRRGELLADLLYQYQPGDAIDVTVVRDGDEVTLSVELAERPID
jgi:S1-C subfamily serine protease